MGLDKRRSIVPQLRRQVTWRPCVRGGRQQRRPRELRAWETITHYIDTYQTVAAVPPTPVSLVNFGEAVNFPLIFGGVLALFGAATLAHLLTVSVSRRGREIVLLKVLGLLNGQIVSVVGWQATTVAIAGIVIGLPLGVLAG